MTRSSGKYLCLFLLLAFMAIPVSACWGGDEFSGKIIDSRKTEERGGLVYEIGSEVPFTGKVVSMPLFVGLGVSHEIPSWTWESWCDCSNKQDEADYLDGKKHGKWIWWSHGKKTEEADMFNGEFHGVVIGWYESGQKKFEKEYRDGELVGEQCWDEDGNPIECE